MRANKPAVLPLTMNRPAARDEPLQCAQRCAIHAQVPHRACRLARFHHQRHERMFGEVLADRRQIDERLDTVAAQLHRPGRCRTASAVAANCSAAREDHLALAVDSEQSRPSRTILDADRAAVLITHPRRLSASRDDREVLALHRRLEVTPATSNVAGRSARPSARPRVMPSCVVAVNVLAFGQCRPLRRRRAKRVHHRTAQRPSRARTFSGPSPP